MTRRPAELTGQQRAILAGVADGMTNEAIARRQRLGVEEMKTALAAMYRLLGANSRAHLVRLAYDRGLLVPPVPTGGSDQHIAACFAARACPCRKRAAVS